MTREETAKILKTIRVSYINQTSKWTNKDKQELLEVWYGLFKDYDYLLVQKALVQHEKTSGNDFVPTPPAIFAQIEKIQKELERPDLDNKKLDKFSAWELIEKCMKSSELHYEPSKAFSKLPKLVQKTIGNVSTLVNWSRADFNRLSFIKRDFLARFEEYEEYASETDYLALPETEIKQLEGEQEKYEKEFATVTQRLAERLALEMQTDREGFKERMNKLGIGK